MKKIISLGFVVLIVMALIAGGTWAFFSSTQTVTGNTFVAGTLTLKVNSGVSTPFNVSNIYPSANGTAAVWKLENSGSINGTLEIDTSTLDHTDKLMNYLKVLLWVDANNNGLLNTGDIYLDSTGIHPWSGTDGAAVNSAEALAVYSSPTAITNKQFTPVLTINHGVDTNYFRANYYFPESGSAQNDAQGDNCTFNLTFTLMQSSTP